VKHLWTMNIHLKNERPKCETGFFREWGLRGGGSINGKGEGRGLWLMVYILVWK
jgi:hypothetical protein